MGDDEAGADEIIKRLGLEPLATEGGQWTVAWRDEGLSSIYFLVRPDDFSAMHRLSVTEVWHHYAGAPTRMLLLGDDGSIERPVLGSDLAAGQRPLIGVPAGVWMGAATEGAWSLLGTTLTPPWDESFFTIGKRDELVVRYPDAAEEIDALVRPEGDEP
ncbi:MAG: cupin domain-containing protein [Actinomycetota bacterium]